ncbi:MAG: GAF domain-containing protein [Elusimicrobiota bacterium]
MEREVLDGFFEIAKTISASLDLDTILKKIGLAAEQVTDSEASSIMLLEDDKQHLYFKSASGEKSGVLKKFKIPISSGIAGWVASNRESVIVADAQNDARFFKKADDSSGFITRSILCVPMIVGNELIGVAEVLNKKTGTYTQEDKETLENLANFAAVVLSNAKYAEAQRNFFVNIMEILASASESRDPRLAGHNWRVAQRSLAVAREFGMDQKEYQDLYYAALLHDIGFLAPGDLSLRERKHPVLGAEMIKDISSLSGAVPVIRYHEDRYDGMGSDPEGPIGEKVPLGARIVGTVEYYEKRLLEGETPDKIVEEIQSGAGTKFDPQVAKVFTEQIKMEI